MFVVVIFVPVTHSVLVREVAAKSNGGALNHYDHCSFSSSGIGRFRPLDKAQPFIGNVNAISTVAEERIEFIAKRNDLPAIFSAVKAVHPYEEPAMYCHEIDDYKNFLLQGIDVPLPKRGVSIVLEGLDGVGKSTVAEALASRLSARHFTTPPPQMSSYRSWFTTQDTATRRAFYMVGNFMAGQDMQSEVVKGNTVVLDRYYASTMAYILGKEDRCLPASGDPILQWPSELYRPDFMFVLRLPEEARIARRATRTNIAENAEEKLLRERPDICARINELYKLFGCIVVDLTESDSVDTVVDKIVGLIHS